VLNKKEVSKSTAINTQILKSLSQIKFKLSHIRFPFVTVNHLLSELVAKIEV